MKTNSMLGTICLALLVVSALSYRHSVTRAERFERGQKFLAQLNADEIDRIEITRGEEAVTLKRGEESFLVASQHNYPAKNDAINRFINDALSISLEKEVGSGEKLETELELATGTEAATEYVFKNDAGKVLVHFMVGKSSEDGRGSYLKHLNKDDQAVYLSSKGVFLSTKADHFLKKSILDVASDKIQKISGKDFTISDVEGSLKLDNLPAGKKEGSELSGVKNMLSSLSFDNVFLADDSQVTSLNFNESVSVALKDKSSYKIEVASKDDKHYLRLSAQFDAEQIRLGRDDTKEQLEEYSATLTRNDEVTEFNNFHGSWVYEVSEFTAKKFIKTRAELIEDEKKDDTEG